MLLKRAKPVGFALFFVSLRFDPHTIHQYMQGRLTMKHSKLQVICIYSSEGCVKELLLESFIAFVRKSLYK